MKRNLGLFLAVALAGCTSPPVSRDYDPKQDFTAFKTWAWSPEAPPVDPSDIAVSGLTHERVRGAIEHELAAKNLQKVDPGAASFWVQFTAIRRALPSGYNYGYSNEDYYLVDVGTIVIDITSPKDKRLVWRGVGNRTIEPDLTPEQREKQIQELTREILAQYPPEPQKRK